MTSIANLTELTDVDETADFVAIVDTSTNTTKKAKPKNLVNGYGVTKGNMLAADGTNYATLTVGSNNQVLTADSAQTYGVKWATPATGGQSGDMIYPLNVTIGDYTSPAAATATSTASETPTYTTNFSSSTGWTLSGMSISSGVLNITTTDGDKAYYDLTSITQSDWIIRGKLVLTIPSGGYNGTVAISLTSSAPSGINSGNTYGWTYCIHRNNDASINDSLVEINNDTIYSAATVNDKGIVTAGGTFYLEFKKSGTTLTITSYTDGTYAVVSSSATQTVANGLGAQTIRYLSVYGRHNNTITGTLDDLSFYDGVSSITYSASLSYDNSTTTYWKSASEANPAIYVDLSSARDIASIALNINKTATTETAIKIRCSTDTSFSAGETVRTINISDFTDDTWRFIPINRLAADCRYVQIYGSSGSTVTLSINEIKVYYAPTTTDWNRKHFHKYLDPTSTSDNTLDSN